MQNAECKVQNAKIPSDILQTGKSFPLNLCTYCISFQRKVKYLLKHKNKRALSETLRKEVVSLGFYPYKTNDTLHKDCESVIMVYIL